MLTSQVGQLNRINGCVFHFVYPVFPPHVSTLKCHQGFHWHTLCFEQWMSVGGLCTFRSPQPRCWSLNAELSLCADSRRATWWRGCDFNLAPHAKNIRHWLSTGIKVGGRRRRRRRRRWSAFGEFATASPLLSSPLPSLSSLATLVHVSRLTCDPFVWLAVTVVRVSGKVQRVQRADAARAICAEREGHRWQDQRGDRPHRWRTGVCSRIIDRRSQFNLDSFYGTPFSLQ